MQIGLKIDPFGAMKTVDHFGVSSPQKRRVGEVEIAEANLIEYLPECWRVAH
jgi:hypothetical protein